MPRILSMDSLPKDRALSGQAIFERMQKEYLDFMTKEELIYYAQSRDFFIYDQNAFKQIAREEGFEEGRLKGREEGRGEGREQGLFAVARTMIAQDFPLETIATVTGLSIEVVEALAKEEGKQG
mgnify:CR=1 FL=1